MERMFPSIVKEPGSAPSLYSLFQNPRMSDRPFVRWWWNGDRIEKKELSRELHLLKEAGIGGVEINPVRFPARTDSMGIRAISWLSDEWIELFRFACDEARSLGLTCDLIVGSGWPFGAEWLEGEERSQVVVIGTHKLEGPIEYEVSVFELFKEADPPISSPFPGRKMEMLSVTLAPSPMNSINDIIQLTDQIPGGTIRCKIPPGKFVLYAMARINGFMEVIQGAPGATGPVLNHYNESAVRKYLSRMSDAIRHKIGPLSGYIRALFTDSLELEGANWCEDLTSEFQKRRGYDIMPYLPYLLFKISAMGNTWSYDHGAELSGEMTTMLRRMRYDFELTKTELIEERFARPFAEWCRENKVLSRVQAYGRGYFPLEGSFDADIPECETWIRPGLGYEMSETDYRLGRAYTVVNKFVSSAAHFQNKKQVSCEELTNIHQVFNESLEIMKVAGDQSIISGTTHPVFHGFNYSPPGAPFPGWVIYGTFINEVNPWWSYFPRFTNYKARLSALLQESTMFADIALLPATGDLWSLYSAQNDPFPAVLYPDWQTLVWEAIHKNGSGCDYISEKLVGESIVEQGFFRHGERRYHSLFLLGVESLEPSTARKLYELARGGVKVFFVDTLPSKACGWRDHEERDRQVLSWMDKMQEPGLPCYRVSKPVPGHLEWYKIIQQQYRLDPYVRIDVPCKFISQVRYQTKDVDAIVFINSNVQTGFSIYLTVPPELRRGRQAWWWDPETGERFRVKGDAGNIDLELGPADLRLLVFDRERKGQEFRAAGDNGLHIEALVGTWALTSVHVNGSVFEEQIQELADLKDREPWKNFCGYIVYKFDLVIGDKRGREWLDLGKVHGVAELTVNGKTIGTRWYGRRIFRVGPALENGTNHLEVKVTTTMGNYLKDLKDNKVAQYWTNEGRTVQPLQSIGMEGPAKIY
jgi:hypothetical protein